MFGFRSCMSEGFVQVPSLGSSYLRFFVGWSLLAIVCFVMSPAVCSVILFSCSEIGELRFWHRGGSVSLTRKGLFRLQ